ncbi:MAG: cytochrome c oxidase assembly protein [Thermoleophilaceae bacterium]
MVAAGAYLARTRTLAVRGKPVPALRQVAFLSGIAVILLSLASPVAHLGEELLLAHMAQHLLMADVGALLHGARADRPGAGAAPAAAARSRDCGRSPIRSWPCRCGWSGSTRGTSRSSTSGRSPTRASTR